MAMKAALAVVIVLAHEDHTMVALTGTVNEPDYVHGWSPKPTTPPTEADLQRRQFGQFGTDVAYVGSSI